MGERKKQRTEQFKQGAFNYVAAKEFMAYNLKRLERILFIFEFTGIWTCRHPQIANLGELK
jgi:hypothetical protein